MNGSGAYGRKAAGGGSTVKAGRVAAVIAIIAAAACILAVVSVSRAGRHDRLRLNEAEGTGRIHFAGFTLDLGRRTGSGTVTVEQWSGGECVKSAPVVLHSLSEEISLSMRIRYEESVPVGVDTQIRTGENGGSLLTYFAFPEEDDMRGWSFTSYERGDEFEIFPGEERILAAMAFDTGQGVRVYDCETLLSDPERLADADYMIVVRASFSDESVMPQEEAQAG